MEDKDEVEDDIIMRLKIKDLQNAFPSVVSELTDVQLRKRFFVIEEKKLFQQTWYR